MLERWTPELSTAESVGAWTLGARLVVLINANKRYSGGLDFNIACDRRREKSMKVGISPTQD